MESDAAGSDVISSSTLSKWSSGAGTACLPKFVYWDHRTIFVAAEERNCSAPAYKLAIRGSLVVFLNSPHLQQECAENRGDKTNQEEVLNA
jgi:hypothetical protein